MADKSSEISALPDRSKDEASSKTAKGKKQPKEGGKAKPKPAKEPKAPAPKKDAAPAPLDPDSIFKEGFLKAVIQEKPTEHVITRFPVSPSH